MARRSTSSAPASQPSLGFLLPLVEAGLRGDRTGLEESALAASRALRASDPRLADGLAAALARGRVGAAPAPGLPSDPETSAFLLRREQPAPGEVPAPILPAAAASVVARFVRERGAARALLERGLEPPRLLLLHGAPGTGKTMLARRLAAELGLPLCTLDLATAISSLLGKTGLNLRRVLDYGRGAPCLLFLDEFDAVAKRRDDASDVGELKRVVNVLLKELERWPSSSVLVAATNHPALLDRAVFRRFDLALELPLPGPVERAALLRRVWPVEGEGASDALVAAAAALLDGESPAGVVRYAGAVARRRVVEGGAWPLLALAEGLPRLRALPPRARPATVRAWAAAFETGRQGQGEKRPGWVGLVRRAAAHG